MIKKIYQAMAAMKTGLFLLLLIGLLSALGSAFLPGRFHKNWGFILLLALLLLNLSLCTINQLLASGRKVVGGSKLSPGLLRQGGLLILHAGMIFILLGGFLQIFYGQQAEITLVRQQSAAVSKFMRLNQPFTICLNDFEIRYNQDGSASQYCAYVSIIENGQSRKTCISVNHPLDYRGVKAYQMSFGNLIKVRIDSSSGASEEGLYKEGTLLDPGQSPYRLKIYRYLPNFDPASGMTSRTLRPDNPHLVFSVYRKGQLQGAGALSLHESVQLDSDHTVIFEGVEPYTVLKLKSDPGLPWAFAGGLGAGLGFFMYWISSVWLRKKHFRPESMRMPLENTGQSNNRGHGL